mgnify:CR=1 FL=1
MFGLPEIVCNKGVVSERVVAPNRFDAEYTGIREVNDL